MGNPQAKVSIIPLGPIEGLPMWLDSDSRRAAILWMRKHKSQTTGLITQSLTSHGVTRYTLLAMEREGALTRNTKTESKPLQRVDVAEESDDPTVNDGAVRVDSSVTPEGEVWEITPAGLALAEKLWKAIT